MLTNDYGEKLSKRIKDALFSTQMSLMSIRFQLPYLLHFFLQIITFWIGISIFFISDPLQPQTINEIFKFSLIPSLSSWTGIPTQIFKIFFLIEEIALIAFFIVHLRSNMMNNMLTKFLNMVICENLLLLVIKTHLWISGIQQITQQSSLSKVIMNIAFAIITIMSTIAVGILVYFKIRPFRKKSVFWSLNNQREFDTFVINFVRVVIIMVDGRTVAFLIVSLLMEVVMRKRCNGSFTKENRKVKEFASNLNLSVHISLLIDDFTSSAQLASEILCFLLAISLISGSLSCYSAITEQRYFPLCQSPLHQFYDFYFNFIQKKVKGSNRSNLSMKNKSQSNKILTIHLLNCQQKGCHIKNVKFSEQTYCEDLENLCNDLMLSKSTQTKENELVYELWKFETGNKHKFRMQGKSLQILPQYIIYCALNYSKLNQKSDTVSQQNIKSLKSIFYDKLQNTLQCFSMLYQQITKTQPKIDTILSVGNDIKKRTSDLKTLYSQLLKHSVINFKTAEVYVEFENYFLKENNVNEESIDRLRKIQKSKEAETIEEMYLPTLTAYSDTGLIQNMNTECLSFFRLTRFEMKAKNINSLIYPESSSITSIKEKLNFIKSRKLSTFFKRRDQIIFGSVTVKEKYIENKKFDVIMIEKNPYSDYRNVLLLNKNSHEIEVLQKQETFVRPNINLSTQLVLKWRYLFQNYLLSRVEDLVNERVIKVRIAEVENSLFVMSLEESFDENYLLINVKVIKDMQKKRNRVSSFMLNKPQDSSPKQMGRFQFLYDLKDNNILTLYGVNDQNYRYHESLGRTKSLGMFERDLSNALVTGTLLKGNRFSQGIKTYRLWQGQLYNIDLQDKQQYVQQFQDHIFNAKDNSELQTGQIDLYIMAGIFFTALIIVALIIIYNTYAISAHEDLSFYYTNGFRIQQLRMQMNRMCSITRDYENNIYANSPALDWKKDLLRAYNSLKAIRLNSLIFDSNQITVLYRDINYTGTLNQIIDVMVSHIYEMTLGNIPLKEIKYFHDSYIADLNIRIINAKLKILQGLDKTANDFQKFQKVSLIVGGICIFAFYALLGALIGVLNNFAKRKLKNLMMMSDNEARMNQITADKLKYAVDMIKKNFDFDLKMLMGPLQSHRPRKKPKQAILGIQKKLIIIIGLIIGFFLHFILFYNFSSQVAGIIFNVRNFQYQGTSYIETYSVFAEQVNKMNHFGVYDIGTINLLRSKVSSLATNRLKMKFDQDTNYFINLIFFQNSCKTLYNMNLFLQDNVTCGFFLPNYVVGNAFQMGMVEYFSRAHYNILDNITETYGVTGLYSGPFIKVFSMLGDKIQAYGTKYIEESFDTFTIYNLVYIAMSVVYVVLTLVIIYVLKGMNKQINELLKFLNVNSAVITSTKKNGKIKKEDKDKNHKEKDVSLQSLSDDKIPSSQNSFNSISQDGSEQKR